MANVEQLFEALIALDHVHTTVHGLVVCAFANQRWVNAVDINLSLPYVRNGWNGDNIIERAPGAKLTPPDHAAADHAPAEHAQLNHAPADHAPLDHAPADHAALGRSPPDHAQLDHAVPDMPCRPSVLTILAECIANHLDTHQLNSFHLPLCARHLA